MCLSVWLEFDRPEATLWGWHDTEIQFIVVVVAVVVVVVVVVVEVVVVVVIGLVLVVVAPKQLNFEVSQCRLKVLDIKIK